MEGKGETNSKALKRVVFGDIFNQVYSVDVGSSHVVLATGSAQAILREPCLIALAPRKAPSGRKARASVPQFRVQAVGRDASTPVPGEENGLQLVHPIEHGRIADADALELVLRKVIEQARMNPLRKAVFGARMTLLTALHLEERDRLGYQDLLRDFGFNRLRLLDAPVASALGAGLDTGESRGQMLIDIGGGQTTVVTFTMGSIVAWHWCPVGGRALDEAIAAHVQQRYRLHLHPATAESIKLALGSVYPRARPETLDISGFDTATGVEKKVSLDDNELRDVLMDGCEPLVMAIHQSFDGVPPELAADISQGEITLVGGGALLSGLPEFLAERTGLRYRVAADPINAAIRGAFANA
ncbi:MAG TPA: rod shape-determining protein [bacterium]|nr:rod shape-determining protein [bacterium]